MIMTVVAYFLHPDLSSSACSTDKEGQTHRVNSVIHKLINFSPLESRLPTVPHDFGVGSCHKEWIVTVSWLRQHCSQLEVY